MCKSPRGSISITSGFLHLALQKRRIVNYWLSQCCSLPVYPLSALGDLISQRSSMVKISTPPVIGVSGLIAQWATHAAVNWHDKSSYPFSFLATQEQDCYNGQSVRLCIKRSELLIYRILHPTTAFKSAVSFRMSGSICYTMTYSCSLLLQKILIDPLILVRRDTSL